LFISKTNVYTLKILAKMSGKRATKHCCWGTCKSDSRYPEKMPEGTTFIRFPKPESIHENMTHWEKEQAKLKTEKRWQYLCGHKDFTFC
jgi:hypothetical protein